MGQTPQSMRLLLLGILVTAVVALAAQKGGVAATRGGKEKKLSPPVCECPEGFEQTADPVRTESARHNGAATCFVLCKCKNGCGCTQKLEGLTKSNVALLGVFAGNVKAATDNSNAIAYMRTQFDQHYISTRATQKETTKKGLTSSNCAPSSSGNTLTPTALLGAASDKAMALTSTHKTLSSITTTNTNREVTSVSSTSTLDGSKACGFPIPKVKASANGLMHIHEASQWKNLFKKKMAQQGYTEDVFGVKFDDGACKQETGTQTYYANTATMTLKQSFLTGNGDLKSSCKCILRYAIGIFTHPNPSKVEKGEQMVNGGVELTAIAARGEGGQMTKDQTCVPTTCNMAVLKTQGKSKGLDDAVRAAVGIIRFELTRKHLEEAMRYQELRKAKRAMKKVK